MIDISLTPCFRCKFLKESTVREMWILFHSYRCENLNQSLPNTVPEGFKDDCSDWLPEIPHALVMRFP